MSAPLQSTAKHIVLQTESGRNVTVGIDYFALTGFAPSFFSGFDNEIMPRMLLAGFQHRVDSSPI